MSGPGESLQISNESGPAGADPTLALARHAIDSMYAAVERQQRWYSLNAAVTVHAVQQLQAGAAADGAFLRTVAAALSTLEAPPTTEVA